MVIMLSKHMWVFEKLAGKWDTSGVSSWRPVPGLLSWCSDFGSGHCGSSGVRLSEVSSSGARSSVGSRGLGTLVSAPWRQAGAVVPGLAAGRRAPFPFHNDWAEVYMRHNVDSYIYVVSLYIDNKHILNLNLNSLQGGVTRKPTTDNAHYWLSYLEKNLCKVLF